MVGRITAQVDRRWDEYQGGSDGMFGFFECEDDPEVAEALVERGERLGARASGRSRLVGPMDFTTNDECGLLIEGYDEPSMILEPWHPPYYRELLEGLGLTKTMDLLMWELWLGTLKQGDQFHEFIEQAADKSRDEHGVVVRPMRKRDLEAEIARFMEVYNEAWGRNWGFVPVTEDEVAFQAKNLKPILDEDWAMIAEREGEVVGAALTLPDIDQVLTRMNGRLLPVRLVALPRRQAQDRPGAGLRARRQAAVPAPRRRGGALRSATASRRARMPQGRAHGLDPRDERADEPRDGGHGRQGRAALPAVRAAARRPGEGRGRGRVRKEREPARVTVPGRR